MTSATTFSKRSEPIAFDRSLGLCFGWLCFSKKDGAPYVDAHGDHFPDDELVKAVDGLMAKPASEREINVEHAGPARGSIATAQALTEDVAKSLGVDTAGTYGVIGSFRPDAELMKSILAGERFCLSIEGKAYDVEEIAKSADAAPAPEGCKRIMRKVELTKLAVVKAPAHEGAAVTLIKSARAVLVAKRAPALTTPTSGHAHTVYDAGEPEGRTSWECMEGDGGCGHSHPFVRGPDGALVIGMSAGHTHEVAVIHDHATASHDMEKPMADDTAKSLAAAQADLAKSNARLATFASLPADQLAFAKRLDGASLAAFLDAPEADRKAKATPIHKSERTGRVFFAGEEPLVEFAKDADDQAAKFAKAEQEREAVTFEKRAAAELGNTYGDAATHVAVLKSAEGKPLTDAEKAKVRDWHKAVNTAYGEVFKSRGMGTGGAEPAGPQAELDKLAADLQKANPSWSFAKAQAEACGTERGRQLYDAIEKAKGAPRPVA